MIARFAASHSRTNWRCCRFQSLQCVRSAGGALYSASPRWMPGKQDVRYLVCVKSSKGCPSRLGARELRTASVSLRKASLPDEGCRAKPWSVHCTHVERAQWFGDEPRFLATQEVTALAQRARHP